ncbi:site-specific recombinase XerD [Sediminihabitans luteus]|uniref:Site-specific recombinase XerD n=1 Tax=Sediminihabitans luteus TaxID=1138585 RepID=A0A2M9D0C4_9CELL|nr:site-specific integrase [Sediminihabitans luteus]PJJ77458.1 site-specific recombinase XerD [Sediminihabitans luteus]GII98352.1 putative phage integrase [Sediminihabitans luteus]
MTRRPHGTGSVYYDPDRDRWIGTYEAGFTERGTRRRRKVTATTERGARQKLLAALRAAEAAEAPTAGGKPNVKRWAETWLDITKTRLRPNAWNANRSLVNRWIVPTIGHKRLDTLSPGDVRSVTRAIDAAGLAPSTALRAHVVLQKMLRDAIVEGYQVPQSARLVLAPTKGETDRDAIPLTDALALLEVAADRPDGSRWVAALLQGMRQGECLGLTWDAVNLEAGTLDVSWQLQPLPYNVPRDRASGFRTPVGYKAVQLEGAMHLVRPKSKSGTRVIPLVPWMTAALTAWKDVAPESPHGLVWPRAKGRPQTAAADRAAWVELQEAAGVRRNEERFYVPHEARHTTATLLMEAGQSEATIIAIMGHSSIAVTRGYQHVSQTLARKAMEDVAARLGLVAG